MLEAVGQGYRVDTVSLDDSEFCHGVSCTVLSCPLLDRMCLTLSLYRPLYMPLVCSVIDLGTIIARSIAGWSPSECLRSPVILIIWGAPQEVKYLTTKFSWIELDYI